MSTLLRTKIQLPPLRSQYIQRERILAYIESDPAVKLVLISASAGFGKSTALTQWAHSLRKDGILIAWYGLDDRDNDPMRFAAYLLESFRLCGSVFSSLPDTTEQTTLGTVVDHVLNAASTLESPLMLILDDYHLIDEPQIHDAIGRMCDHMPINMRLAIGSRADPPLQLARMRVRGEICEIRMGDLRFTTGEMRDWVNHSLGWRPSAGSISELTNATEGWAAALALILMNQPSADEVTLIKQLERYSQSKRHIFDYFAQEILSQQPESIRDFLLQTCVLNQLKPDLCQAMMGQANAPLMLEEIARQSLFVIPLSDAEPVYRYHHLFADFLRQYLELTDQAGYLGQHRRAAQWYEAQEDVVEAINHAFAAKDFDYAVTLIEQKAWETLNTRGEFITLVNWLPHIPEEVLKQHLRLWLRFVHALHLTGQIELAETHVDRAVDALNQYEAEGDKWNELRAIAYNRQATLAAYRGDINTAGELYEQANALRDWVELPDRLRIANGSGFVRFYKGDVPDARQAYEQALLLAEKLNHHYQILDIHFYLAQLDFLEGDLTATQKRCEDLLAQYSNHPMSALIMLPLARGMVQRNQVVQAEALLRNAITLGHQANLPACVLFANMDLSDLLLARGEFEQAAACLTQARQFARGYNSPMADSLVAAAEARHWLRSGQIEHAIDWATWYQETESKGYVRDDEDITLARVFLAQGHFTESLLLLRQIIEHAQAGGRIFTIIQAEILCAQAYYAIGQHDEAYDALHRALELAAPGGLITLFNDAGHTIHKLLRRAAEEGHPYASDLVDIIASMERVQHPADMLTEREIEVLQYMAAGASNKAIADGLVLSVGTVKSHIHHIMNKLDAQNRTEAVSKARSLNILPD